MKYLLAGILLLVSLGCFAAIYMQTDANGNVVYSDTPESNAQPVKLPSSNNSISVPQKNSTPSDTKLSATATALANDKEAHKDYTRFVMITPTDQQTFQNTRDIQIIVQMEPSLQEGDKVQVLLDGIPAGPASSDLSQLYVHQADRGEHTIAAEVVDSSGNTLKKVDPVTVFIHYSALPTASGGLAPTGSESGIAPSSPGSGITPPASQGSGIIPPGGSGIVPSGGGSGVVPPASGGSGIVPSIKPGTPVY